MEHASTPPWRLDLEESVYTERERATRVFVISICGVVTLRRCQDQNSQPSPPISIARTGPTIGPCGPRKRVPDREDSGSPPARG